MHINKHIVKISAIACMVCLLTGCLGVQSNDSQANYDQVEEIAYLRLQNDYWQVWLTDREGRRHRQLTFDPIDKTRVSWSPDHKQLLCNLNDGRLQLVSIKEGGATLLRLPVKGMLDAQWSPDGRRIVYSLSSTQIIDANDLWVINLNGTGMRKLLKQPGIAQWPSWHPNGRGLAYTQFLASGEHHVWIYTDAGGNREQLTVGKSGNYDPAYSAKGELAYSSNQSGNYEIWLRDIEGKTRALTRHPAYDAQPAWSPTGDAIAFYSLRGGSRRIWVKSLEDQTLMPLTPANVSSRNPIWN